MSVPRPEYPRPQLARDEWLNLNGTWRFAFDDDNIGLSERWFEGGDLDRDILVPFAFQASLSGIGETDFHDIVWYARQFEIPESWQGCRLLLHFGAVDYRAWVWVNGAFVALHEGGHVPFTVDVTGYVNESDNRIVVRVEDISEDKHQPRGKQYWERESAKIFYTRTTGIWQTVWMEPVGEAYIRRVHITPLVDEGAVRLEYDLGGSDSHRVEFAVSVGFDGDEVVQATQSPDKEGGRYHTQTVALDGEVALWSPEQPNLYDLQIEVRRDGQVLDRITSYFGMRKIEVRDGRVHLNDQPYIMRLVLDQGYHPQGVLTFPDDETIRRDVELTKALGFNGARKHQKVAEPRYLYWADRLGLLVWGEMANAWAFSPESVARITAEWQEAILRDYNHPCIVAWVPINESWGVPKLANPRQRGHLVSLYHLTKSLDVTRLIVSNDGWQHAQTDLLTIHDYESDGKILRERYASIESTLAARPHKNDLYAPGFEHTGEPVLLTEFGGIGFRTGEQEGWGYSTSTDETGFLAALEEVVSAVDASPVLQGFCYTQLTDVEQEINGLLTYDRQPKADLAAVARIIRGRDD